MRRALFFIVAISFAATSFASIPRASMPDRASEDASAFAQPLSETRIRVSDVLAPFERQPPSELTRALHQAYGDSSTTDASGLGRFLSVDPTWESADLGKPQSWNRYAYVMNNPVNMTDPDGKLPFLINLLGELAVDFVTDGNPANEGAANPPRSQAEFDQRVKDGRAIRTYETYTKTHPEKGTYTGRTSGTGAPEQNVARRDASHHKNAEGYDPAKLDKSSTNPGAIRGREQQGIVANGGARSKGGTSGNAIDGISHKNPKKPGYIKKAVREFGDFLLRAIF